MSNAPIKKVTEFDAAASGDCECFCFDRRTNEQRQADEGLWEVDGGRRALVQLQHEARIYPDHLLPEEARDGHEGVYGHYRITVEFWPADPK